MTREDVIKAMECCQSNQIGGLGCDRCPNLHTEDCEGLLHHFALELLKAQEPTTSESISSAIECLLHPQDADDSDMIKAIDTAVRAMRLLKAQEPVEPVFERRFMTDIKIYDCGKCGTSLGAEGIAKYCMACGQAVKWE